MVVWPRPLLPILTQSSSTNATLCAMTRNPRKMTRMCATTRKMHAMTRNPSSLLRASAIHCVGVVLQSIVASATLDSSFACVRKMKKQSLFVQQCKQWQAFRRTSCLRCFRAASTLKNAFDECLETTSSMSPVRSATGCSNWRPLLPFVCRQIPELERSSSVIVGNEWTSFSPMAPCVCASVYCRFDDPRLKKLLCSSLLSLRRP